MKSVILLVFYLVAIDLISAYPLSRGRPKLIREGALNDDIREKGQVQAEDAAWRALAQLSLSINDQARDRMTYSEAETEGITRFFANLKDKFQEFGKRIRHAFRPSGKK